MSIKAITFDLDDTLWPIMPVIEKAERVVHAHLSRHYPCIAERYDIPALRELRREVAHDETGRAHDLAHLRRESLRRAAQGFGYDVEEVAQSCYEIFDRARHDVTLYPDVLPVLNRLYGRYRLGVLSNGTADVRRLGLGHLFSFTVSALEVGEPKPASAMFLAACRAAGARPAEVAHVGDHYEHDIEGALAAGLLTIWINRRDEPWPGTTPAHAEIRTLAELESTLALAQKSRRPVTS